MRLLQNLCRIIQTVLLFLIPLILFYWFLFVLNIGTLKPFIAILGFVFDPYIEMIRPILHLELFYNNIRVDFTPLIAAGVMFAVYFAFLTLDNLFGYLQNTVKESKEKIKEAELLREQEIIRKNYLEALARNKVIQLVLKLNVCESSSSYLFCKENDIFSEGLTNTVLNNIIEASSKYEAKKYNNLEENDNDIHNFIFYDITKAIDYAFYVFNKVTEANKNIIDPSIRVAFSIACNCSYSESTAKKDFAETYKVLKLGGDYEIITTELFKEKYEALKEETNLLFVSKGIYNINEKQIETFQIKLAKAK